MTFENCQSKAGHFDAPFPCECTGGPRAGLRLKWSRWWVGFEWHHCWHELDDGSDWERQGVGRNPGIEAVEHWEFFCPSSFPVPLCSTSFLLGAANWLVCFATSQTCPGDCNHKRKDCQLGWFCGNPYLYCYEVAWKRGQFCPWSLYWVVWFCCRRHLKTLAFWCSSNWNPSRTIDCWRGISMSMLGKHPNRRNCCWYSWKSKSGSIFTGTI